jgi:mRNA interferase MazF
VRRGEVHWYRFPSPDKRRPVVILTRSDLLPHLTTVTIAAVTSTRRGVPSEVPIGPEEGMPRACAVNLHNVFTVPKSEVGPFLATLPEQSMVRIDRALVFALGVGERRADLH